MQTAVVRRGIVAFACWLSTVSAPGAELDQPRSASGSRVQAALADMHAWVGDGENGRRWRNYLMSQGVQTELGRGTGANPAALNAPLARYRSGAAGLDLPPFTAVRTALANWQQQLQESRPADLPALARAAAEQFEPVTPAQLAAARRELEQHAQQLDRYLSRAGANGRAWKDYLLFDSLQEQLAAEDPPDVTELAEVYRRFRAVHQGLEFPVFASVADSLERYINLVNFARVDVEEQPRQYTRQLDLLAQDIEAYLTEGSEQQAYSLGRRLGFVAGLGQAPRFIQAVRQRLARPNLQARLDEALLTAATAQPVRDTRPVTDVILGTYISGTATTDAQLFAQTVPSGRGPGRIELVLGGAVYSDTVGRNGPVCIYSTGQTPFTSRKLVTFDQYGFREMPATTQARTCTDIHCIQPVKSGIGSGLVQRIAWKRAGQQKPQAEAVASQRAEERISTGFNTRSLDLLAEAQANYTRNFRLPLVRRNEFPEHFNVATTTEGLWITLLQATPYQLGAPTAPPGPRADYDLSLAVHESLPNNVAASWLSGYRLTQERLRRLFVDAGGEVPPELQGDEAPWSITFASQRPVSVAFEDEGFTVTIRGEQFTSGDDAYGAMNITARYRFVPTDAGLVLRRQGDLEILPPDFVPGEDVLGPEQAALVELLIKHLGDVFKSEIEGEGIELPGELARAGRLLPVEATSRQGWLLLGWNRAGQRTIVADAPGTTPAGYASSR